MRPLKSASAIVTRLVFLFLLLFVFAWPAWTDSVARAQADDAQGELTKGMDLLRRRRFEDALKSFKQANEMRGRSCAECFYGMAQAYFSLLAYKNVIESCDKVIDTAPADKQLQSGA